MSSSRREAGDQLGEHIGGLSDEQDVDALPSPQLWNKLGTDRTGEISGMPVGGHVCLREC